MSETEVAPLTKPGGRGLTEAGARRGLELRRGGHTYSQIAQALGCSVGTAFNLCNAKSWEWLRLSLGLR